MNKRERGEQIGQNNCQEGGKVKRWRWACYNENDRVKEEGKKKERKIQLTIPFKSYGDATGREM